MKRRNTERQAAPTMGRPAGEEQDDPPLGRRPVGRATLSQAAKTLGRQALGRQTPGRQALRRQTLERTQPTLIFVHASSRSKRFLRTHFVEAALSEWNDWRWQVRNRLRSAEMLGRVLHLSGSELDAFGGSGAMLPVGITPYYASLLDPDEPTQPLRRTVVPTAAELLRGADEALDPLHEDSDSPVPGLVHRYPDRVLFLAIAFCSTYCRYCTRARAVGNYDGYTFNRNTWERALGYIEAHREVRDVLISGGDPLDLSDEHLEYLLARLRAIKHVEFIRIGTKTPAVLPQRITPALTRMLRKYHPVWMSLHFTHADELTPETAEACCRLSDAGIPLGSQTVLLKGVNDDVHSLKTLFHGLLQIRVRPYYLYQCDPIVGSAHFRTSIERGLQIMEELRGHTTGYALPTYVVDAPGGGGKIPLQPDYLLGRNGRTWRLRNFEGREFEYRDPEAERGC